MKDILHRRTSVRRYIENWNLLMCTVVSLIQGNKKRSKLSHRRISKYMGSAKLCWLMENRDTQ